MTQPLSNSLFLALLSPTPCLCLLSVCLSALSLFLTFFLPASVMVIQYVHNLHSTEQARTHTLTEKIHSFIPTYTQLYTTSTKSNTIINIIIIIIL